MSKFLRALLDGQEPLFSSTLRHLERASGNRAIDAAYIGSMTERAHALMRQLGLDIRDTTDLELYRTLTAYVDNTALFRYTDDVALMTRDGTVISFNHDDVKANAAKPFEQRTCRAVRCHVRHELVKRYATASNRDESAIDALFIEAGIQACDANTHRRVASKDSAPDAPYILCIGDIFTDVFIKLLEDEARIDTDKDGSKRLSIPFGSKPPYDSAEVVHSVGPSPNAAVSMARIGARVGLMSWLGDDQVGKDSLSYLAHEQIDATPMAVQKHTPSNTYYVLRYGADRTILVKNEAYEYRWKAPKTKPDWIYLSLISADSWPLHRALADYLDEHRDVKFALQPGTFHFKWGAKKLARLYKRAEIVVMNREEAVDVTGKSYDSLRELADALHALGPKYVVITDGPNGSYASYAGKLVRVPNYPDPAPPVDRTGAGDAFASTIVAALAIGEPIDTALTWAPINSMSVVQKLGAQAGLLRRREIEKYLKKAPDTYGVKEYR